jgi:HD-like signal output (HDOD) protein
LEEQSFTAGLLHDIGQLLFAANLPKQFGQAVARASELRQSLWEAEVQQIGASHAELGACLLGTWGLPGAIVEAVALHHSLGQSQDECFTALAAVHAANVFAHEAVRGTSTLLDPQLEREYLSRLGLKQGPEHWRRNCLDTREKDQA